MKAVKSIQSAFKLPNTSRRINIPKAVTNAQLRRLLETTTRTTPNTSRRGPSQGMPRLATRCRLSIAAATAATRRRIPIKRRSAGFISHLQNRDLERPALHKKWFLQLFISSLRSLRISVISALSTFYDLELTRSPQRYAEIAENHPKLERQF